MLHICCKGTISDLLVLYWAGLRKAAQAQPFASFIDLTAAARNRDTVGSLEQRF